MKLLNIVFAVLIISNTLSFFSLGKYAANNFLNCPPSLSFWSNIYIAKINAITKFNNYKNELIKNIRFDENRNIGEDTNFNNHFRKEVAKLIDTKYFYNYGINNECLCYKYSRGELQEFKVWN